MGSCISVNKTANKVFPYPFNLKKDFNKLSKKTSPIFSLGKIHSKYLIIEILGYSDTIKNATNMLFRSSRSLKKLLIQNYRYIEDTITSEIPLDVKIFAGNVKQLFKSSLYSHRLSMHPIKVKIIRKCDLDFLLKLRYYVS